MSLAASPALPISARVRAWRIALSATQSTLADLVGVHPQTVSNWERAVLAPTQWQTALLRTLAESPRAAEVCGVLATAGPVAALSVGLEYKLTP